jgi:hypothetical protein
MEVNHVSDGTIGQCRAKNRDVVLKDIILDGCDMEGRDSFIHFIGPVIHRFFVVNFFPQSLNK